MKRRLVRERTVGVGISNNHLLSISVTTNQGRTSSVTNSTSRCCHGIWIANNFFYPLQARTTRYRIKGKYFLFLNYNICAKKKLTYFFIINQIVCCALTGCIIHIEVQEGKDLMRDKDYSKEFGATAGCTVCLARGSKYC